MLKKITIGLLILFIVQMAFAQKPDLRFDKEGKFKIVQFTDIHWDDESVKSYPTIDIIESVLSEEKPNLVVFTGDIAFFPVKKSWQKIAKPVIDKKIFWTYVNGNHDEEFDMDRSKIVEYLTSLPYFIGESGPDNIHGYSNFNLLINGNKTNQPANILYFFDSNSYTHNPQLGYYDWIKRDQVNWYYEQSKAYRKKFNKTLPGLAFFHIPLPEYKILLENHEYLGTANEGVASPVVNSGLFSTFLETGDVMGVFTGHDHNNDFIGTVCDIALAFGRVTGTNAYGDFERGGRVIELEEGERKFTTWIRTKSGVELCYHYPDYDLYETDSTVYLKAIDGVAGKNGLNYTYHEGNFQSVFDMKPENLIKKGITKDITINEPEEKDHFGYIYTGMIAIPDKAIYKFKLSSDDGSVLYIDDKEIIKNDGTHSVQDKIKIVGFDKGLHNFKLLYFDDYYGNELKVTIKSLKMEEQAIPVEMLMLPISN